MNGTCEGILLVDKPAGITSFKLVARLRKLLNVKKIGHAGTLDPFATGVMVMLIGRNYTRQSDSFLTQDKEYVARIELGKTTTTFDPEGEIVETSSDIPKHDRLEAVLAQFQGTIEQVPPMYSAKKVGGKKLCDLARQGKTVERAPAKVHVTTTLLDYSYPYVDLLVSCSKGTYIRSLAHDIGKALGCGGYLVTLSRSRSGGFSLKECIDGKLLENPDFDPKPHLRQ